jgi:hypothetical protein
VARLFEIQISTIESLISIACILNNVNHWDTGLNSNRLGIIQTDLKGLKRYLCEGTYT